MLEAENKKMEEKLKGLQQMMASEKTKRAGNPPTATTKSSQLLTSDKQQKQ